MVPLPDGTVGDVLPGDTVKQTLNEPLPEPVEEVVSESPVAPVREEVRRLVGGATGGSPGGSSGGKSPGTQAGGAAQPGSSPAPSAGGSPRADGPRGGSRREGPRRPGRDRGAARRRERGADVGDRRPGPAGGSRRADTGKAGRPRQTTTDDRRSPLTRTIDKLVEVVPTAVWIVLGVLLLVAGVLGARAFVERRRARALEAERQQLLREVGLLERALLPEVPAQLGALATSVAYRPCEGPAAGGDFYDAFELEAGRVAVLVGDVSGHGRDALENTNSIRSGVRACLEAGMSPRLALQYVGPRAGAQSSGRFTTVIVALHDPRAGTLTYATAGHPPPIVSGPCAHEPLTIASSPPLGLGFRTGLRETTVPLPLGSVACLFTDGLLEARAGDGMIGRERLTAMVAGLGPDESAEALLDEVISAADESPDDMAVCMLRVESGTSMLAPRIETLEVEADDLDRPVAELFLEACEVPAEEAEAALEDASATLASAGGAVIEVTIGDRGARVRVSAARALASPASA
jgi:Stage II sporulation protein E (SpoIIE)